MTSAEKGPINLSHQSSTAIRPEELAKLIGSRMGEGFQPKPVYRTGLAAEAGSFVAADFRASGARLAKLAPTPDPVPTEPAVQRQEPAAIPAEPITKAVPARDIEAELAAAYERGLADGRAEGKAQAEASAVSRAESELKGARDFFLTAAKKLETPENIAASELSAAISNAVSRLASERVGYAIDAHPEAFLDRITVLADRVAQGIRDVTVFMNPEDFELIHKHLQDAEEDGPRMAAAKTLGRGDIEVRCAGISLKDALDQPKQQAFE